MRVGRALPGVGLGVGVTVGLAVSRSAIFPLAGAQPTVMTSTATKRSILKTGMVITSPSSLIGQLRRPSWPGPFIEGIGKWPLHRLDWLR